MVLLGDEPHVEARFGPFGDSASLDVDRCTVCAELLRVVGHVESRFYPFGDGVSVSAT